MLYRVLCDAMFCLFHPVRSDQQVQMNIYLLDFHKREGDQFTFMVSLVCPECTSPLECVVLCRFLAVYMTGVQRSLIEFALAGNKHAFCFVFLCSSDQSDICT